MIRVNIVSQSSPLCEECRKTPGVGKTEQKQQVFRYFMFHAAANRFVQFFAQGNEQGPAKETGGCSRLQDVPFLICSFALSPEAMRESSYLVRNRQGCSV